MVGGGKRKRANVEEKECAARGDLHKKDTKGRK